MGDRVRGEMECNYGYGMGGDIDGEMEMVTEEERRCEGR